MTLSVVFIVIELILGPASYVVYRWADWHENEAVYWARASSHPDWVWQYEVLKWSQAHQPSLWQKVRRWYPPEVRRERAEARR